MVTKCGKGHKSKTDPPLCPPHVRVFYADLETLRINPIGNDTP